MNVKTDENHYITWSHVLMHFHGNAIFPSNKILFNDNFLNGYCTTKMAQYDDDHIQICIVHAFLSTFITYYCDLMQVFMIKMIEM